MEILLLLLSILKYCLLFILFLIIFIIVLVLILMIVPIRYKALVNHKEDDLYFNVNVTYLCKIVGLDIKKENEKLQIFLRLFAKKIKLNKEKPPDSGKEKTKKEKKKKEPKEEQKKSAEDIALETVEKATPTEALEEELKDELSEEVTSTTDDRSSSYEYADSEDKEKTSETLDEEPDEEESKKENIIEKINSIIEKINYYIDAYKTYPYKDKLFKKLKKIFENIFDAIIPKVIDIHGDLWVKDPGTTGQILGYLYALYGVTTRVDIGVNGNFEEEKNDLTGFLSGRIIIFKLVYPVVALLWLGLKAEAKRRKITRFKLIKLLINKK